MIITHNDTQIYVVFITKFNKMEEDKNLEQNLDNSNEKLHISDVMFSSFYEYGKCKLISKEHKEHMIENDMLDLVVKNIHLFEN